LPSWTPDNTHDGKYYLRIRRLGDGSGDARSAEEYVGGEILIEFGDGFTFGVPFVWDDVIHVYATVIEKGDQDDIHVFRSGDMSTWEHSVAVRGESERLYNSTVCRAGDRFVMAYETNDDRWPAFTIKFAESDDLLNWTKIPIAQAIYGTDRYTACPSMRWVDGMYYLVCLEMPRAGTMAAGKGTPGWWFEEFGARSPDLLHWEPSPVNPVLAPEADGSENINTSDIDFCEFKGKTIVYYLWGSQTGEVAGLSHAEYPGDVASWLQSWFPDA
jgi:hypothetical protein